MEKKKTMTEKLVTNGNALRNKKFTMLALVLMFIIALPFAALPASAQTPRTTFTYIGALPNPVGVGQEVLFHTGATEPLTSTTAGYEGLSIIITDPDGHITTIEDIKTDATGGTGRVFIPNIAGNWTVQTHFPEQQVGSTLWLESYSPELTLVVTAEPVEYYPTSPLPTEYWTRPIDNQLRDWYVFAGSWLNTPNNFYAPYNYGPETPHILWSKVLTSGGMVGGELGLVGSGATSVGFETGDAYEGKFGSSGPGPLIVAGKLYYYHSTSWPTPTLIHCVDLRTGEELWAKTFLDNETIDFGQLFYFESFNYQGTFAYLWVTTGGGFFGGGSQTWYAFDALTGDWMYSMEDVPGGTNMYGPSGEICKYSVSTSAKTVTLWNSTWVVMTGRTGTNAGSFGSAAHGNTFDATRGNQYTWDIQYDGSLPGSVLKTFLGDRIIGGTVSDSGVTLWGIDMSPGHEGEMLFEPNTYDAPSYWAEGDITVSGFGGGWFAWGDELAGANVGVLWLKQTREHYGFSTDTGEYLWGPTEPQMYLDALDDTGNQARAIAYGRLYSASVSGIVYCYNATTGEKLWEYDVDDPYTEILWSNNWWQKPLFITDGKIYCGHTEHSANQPLPRGAPMICLNATTGDVIWRANGLFRQTRWGGRAIIGDSVIATMDTYDQQVYAIGKGPTELTVSAPDNGVAFGTSVMIRGTVKDISPGTNSERLSLRFPNGVSAVSDGNQTDWMLYVYKQFEYEPHTTWVGVPVTLYVVDANMNTREIGTATTSAEDGAFAFAWTPDIPGTYYLYAEFEGSKAYYGSHAETAFVVDEALEATPPPTSTPAPMTDTYVLGLGAASIAAIVVIGLVLILMLRKR
jgi:outer membrane protein assembly factor BamB